MPPRYEVASLEPEQIAQAFPLIQATDGAVTLERWKSFAEEMTSRDRQGSGRGIITLRTSQGYIHGLFSYMALPNLRHGRKLLIDDVSMMGIGDRRAIMYALVQSIEDAARREGCAALSIRAPRDFIAIAERRGLIPILNRFEHGRPGADGNGRMFLLPWSA